MKKLSLYIFLVLMFCNVAYSEWIGLSNSNIATIYQKVSRTIPEIDVLRAIAFGADIHNNIY